MKLITRTNGDNEQQIVVNYEANRWEIDDLRREFRTENQHDKSEELEGLLKKDGIYCGNNESIEENAYQSMICPCGYTYIKIEDLSSEAFDYLNQRYSVKHTAAYRCEGGAHQVYVHEKENKVEKNVSGNLVPVGDTDDTPAEFV